MKFVNLTPHTCNIVRGTEVILSIPSSGQARCATLTQADGEIDGIPVVRQEFGPVSGLPAADGETVFIVSMLVAQHPDVAGRSDVVAPNTSQAVRDAGGQIIGVPGFSRY